jgi:protein-S-isoprenylcysteine O-methyltransferase Ste14
MRGFVALAYGLFCYIVFLLTLLYAIGFVGNFVVPKSIDSGIAGAPINALIVDALLLCVFAIQHSVMARPAFKRWWTRLVPPALERSTYVLMASAALLLIYWQWQPLPTPVWSVASPLGVAVLGAIFWLGWATLVISTFVINHFELFGLWQVYAHARGKDSPPPKFEVRSIYRLVRHPIYLGFILAFWSTPAMTAGHLFFAIATTGYILVGIYFEERDLVASFGDQYRRYRGQVRMLLPLPKRHRSPPLRAVDR